MQRINGGSLTIRPSELKDVRELILLDHLIWTEETTPGPLEWRSREDFLLHAPLGSQLVAVQDGELCGYVGFACPSGMESNRHVYEIHIAVHPEHQRQGIGSALIGAAGRHAQRQGIRKLRLRVLASNRAAVAFYRSCGFREDGRLREEYYLGGRYVDELFMSCMLN